MIKINKFNEFNSLKENISNQNSHYSEYVDINILDDIIENMRPNKNSDGELFKSKLRLLNSEYNCSNNKRSPSTFGKKVAWWVDLDLIQDVIDRLNNKLCDNSEEYKSELKNLLEE